ncbi:MULTISPECIES: tyrosine-type recombinase/integrase [unclassified Thiocapsa]|uniref:tyrosine-type recombinase/integrase n=1 Tax=unclassified Thiocapsa TaxID=2641286 RepID=UPI0035B032C3
MRKTITRQLVDETRKRAREGKVEKPEEIRDADIKGFLLRVQPSGVLTFYLQLARSKRVRIGDANILTVAQGRLKAKAVLGAVAEGRDPADVLKTVDVSTVATLRDFITGDYAEWVTPARKTGAALVARIDACFFAEFGDTPLDKLTAWNLEKWRKGRLQQGRTVSTVNRDLSALKSALARALDWGLIEAHPLAKVKPGKVDLAGIVRYLSQDEEARLRRALQDRDAELRDGRARGNEWRRARGHEPMPEIGTFGDHLTPMILVSINTGIRQGELFNLDWSDVDLERASLTVKGSGAKSGQTRHIPLNSEALRAINTWQDQTGSTGLVFAGRKGKLSEIKTAWSTLLKRARIEGFRWHDMRHHFASRLVMAGVDLNTVRELLGHSDLKMTLRYAHLAPEHKAAAVAKLIGGA